MKPLVDLIDDESLKRLARPSDLRLGREIAGQGGVEITSLTTFSVTARAKPPGGQRRTTELFSTEEGLRCRCT